MRAPGFGREDRIESKLSVQDGAAGPRGAPPRRPDAAPGAALRLRRAPRGPKSPRRRGAVFLGALLAAAAISAPAAQAPAGASPPETPPAAPRPDLTDHASAMRDALYKRAVEYVLRYREDDLGQAVRLFNQILRSHNRFAPAFGGLAEARALRYLWGWEPDPGRLRQALEEGRKGVDLGPDLAGTHLGLGLALMASNRYTPALSELNRAVELDPGSFRAHLYRGMILRGLRRKGELAGEVAQVIQLDPSSAAAYSLLGDYYQDVRDYRLARESYLTAALLDQRLVWARLGLAAAYQRELNFSGALKTYDYTRRDFPRELVRCRILMASLMVATQSYEGALKIYKDIPEKEDLSPPLFRRLMLAGRGYSLEKLGSIEKAEYYYSQLTREFPEDFDGAVRDREVVSRAYEGLVRYHDAKKEPERSLKTLEKACRHPGMAFPLYRDLAARRRRSGDLAGAVAVLLKGVKSAPEGLDLLAASEATLPAVRALAGAKREETARGDALSLVDELESRLDGDPVSSYVPYLDLARCEALLGREAPAVSRLRTAIKKGYTGTRKLEKDPDFRTLHGNPEFRELTRAR